MSTSPPSGRRAGPIAVLTHGAGSCAAFLARAFPPERLGVADCVYLEDRTGDVNQIRQNLTKAIQDLDQPVILGGVSLGAHAAAQVLSTRPPNVVGGILCLPAWSGDPGNVADLTGAAADAIAYLGIIGVLNDLPEKDWVTPELGLAWSSRTDPELVAELHAAACSPGPSVEQLESIATPVGIIAMNGDPLHPASVAARWNGLIPRSACESFERDEPARSLAVFADAGRLALRAAYEQPSQ